MLKDYVINEGPQIIVYILFIIGGHLEMLRYNRGKFNGLLL